MTIRCMKMLLIVVVMTGFGCASTVKYDNTLTQKQLSHSTATIKVRRTCSIAGAAGPIGIQDDIAKIGRLGRCGELTWSREPGYVAVFAGFGGAGYDGDNIPPTEVLIFPVEAGKTYSLVTSLFDLQPDNFAQELIVYEEKVVMGKLTITGYWETILKQLQLGQYQHAK